MTDMFSNNKADTASCCISCDPSWRRSNDAKQNFVDDAELAKEMMELSVEERDQIFDDIHAVAKVREETPAFLDFCFQELDSRLSRIPPARRKNLTRALFLRPSLQTDTNFKLMFLRAESYDAIKAAERMARYYDMKAELFGDEKLVKRITIYDLVEEDLSFFKSGFHVNLPFRDKLGRPIIFLDTTKVDVKNSLKAAKCMLRGYWYMTMAAMMDDEMAQKLGACIISYYSGAEFVKPGAIEDAQELAKRRGYMTTCLPCRCTSTRVCYNDPRTELLVGTLRGAHDKSTRLRLRTHMGSDLEHDYFLMSFGMPSIGLIQNAGKGNIEFHEQYIRLRLEIDRRLDESSFYGAQDAAVVVRSDAAAVILYPNVQDVLIGRGIPYQQFPGNVRWDKMIYSNMERYSKSDNFGKTCITMEMINNVHEYNGRFLHRTSLGWEVIEEAKTRAKTASAFRTRLRPTSSGRKALLRIQEW